MAGEKQKRKASYKSDHLKDTIEMDKNMKHINDKENVNTNCGSECSGTNYPAPDNLVEYLPWACKELMFEYLVHVLIHQQNTEEKIKKSRSIMALNDQSSTGLKDTGGKTHAGYKSYQSLTLGSDTITINITVDAYDRIIGLKIPRITKEIPCGLIRLLGLILPFQPHLRSFTIVSGATFHTISHLSKFLPETKITDICLDGIVIEDANYHLLLDCAQLKCLSLRQCGIKDKTVDLIASKLEFKMCLPLQAGLAVLNLSTNFITDRGAERLAQMLRSNRSLCYLNLTGNQIKDEGAISILNSLIPFEMTFDEISSSREHLMHYLRTKTDLVQKIMSQFQTEKEVDRTKKRLSKNLIGKNTPKTRKSDVSNLVNAEEMAVESLGSFDVHPFAKVNITKSEGKVYCKGNNYLTYLGLNYNNLSICFLKHLHNALVVQASDVRSKGLAMVAIDGNPCPNSCVELKFIDYLLQASISKKSGGNVKQKSKLIANSRSR